MIKKNFVEIKKGLKKEGIILAIYQDHAGWITFIVKKKNKIQFYNWDGFANLWQNKVEFLSIN